MSDFMARLGPDSFESNHVGENNSIKYMLELRGSNMDSPPSSAKLNSVSYPIKFGTGLNVIVLDSIGTLVEHRVFDIANVPAHRESFQTYMLEIQNNRIVGIVSSGEIKSDISLDSFMYRIGSRCWPTMQYLNAPGTSFHKSSFSSVYNSNMKKICVENFIGSVSGDSRTLTEVVFDDINDIGATGIPERFIDDYQTTTGNDYPIKTWAYNGKVPDDVKVGEVIFIQADLFTSQEAWDAGARCDIYAWSQDASGVWKNSIALKSSKSNTWETVTGQLVVASGSDSIGTAVYHYPLGNKIGSVSCRNVFMCRLSRGSKVANVGVGINGMRISKASENDVIANLLTLGTQNNQATSNRFKEVQFTE